MYTYLPKIVRFGQISSLAAGSHASDEILRGRNHGNRHPNGTRLVILLGLLALTFRFPQSNCSSVTVSSTIISSLVRDRPFTTNQRHKLASLLRYAYDTGRECRTADFSVFHRSQCFSSQKHQPKSPPLPCPTPAYMYSAIAVYAISLFKLGWR